MKLTHKNIELIENWLDENNLEVQLNDDFIRRVYEEVLEDLFKLKEKESVRVRKRGYELQYSFVRRDLLKISHKRNNKSASGIKAGFVYAIGNSAWPDFVKIGSAIDVDDRLNSYQTSSPLRDYFILDYYCVYDRILEEDYLHDLFKDRNSEWCKVSYDEIKTLFRNRKRHHNITVLPEKLMEVKNQIVLQRSQDEQLRLTAKKESKRVKRQLSKREHWKKKFLKAVPVTNSSDVKITYRKKKVLEE